MFFDNKTLNKNIPVPLYYQLKELLLKEIKSHKYVENDPIPTELELSEYFEISRPTVRQAISELVSEGYLYRVKGKGTFLAKPKIYQQFTQVIDSFNEEMRKKGLLPKTEVLELKIISATEKEAEMLNLKEGSKVTKLKRLRYANDEPILVVSTYIPYDLCAGLENISFERESLYKLFEDKGLYIERVKRIFEARNASASDAQLLGVEVGDAIHYFETVAYLNNDVPIEYSASKYRGDRNKFIVEIKKQ